MKKIIYISLGLIILIGISILIYPTFKKPSHDRIWWSSLSVLPSAEISDKKIKVNNVRDWTYDKDGPVTEKWINREYNLDDLEGVWFFMVPFSEWEGLAHTMMSFDFNNSEPLMISIEARKEKGENYTLLSGMRNEFEMIYIWGTERDFLGDRILKRGDEIYMYPLDINIEFAKNLFVQMLEDTNDIYENPRFYNTLIHNCTNDLAILANKAEKGTVPMSIGRILPGYSFDLLFRLGYIKDSEENKGVLKEKYNATEIMRNYINDIDFSTKLRRELKSIQLGAQ